MRLEHDIRIKISSFVLTLPLYSIVISNSTTQADMDKLKIQYLNDLAEGKVDHARLQKEQKEKEAKMKKGSAPGVH